MGKGNDAVSAGRVYRRRQGGRVITVRGTSPRGPKHFYVYGGPHGGALVKVKGGETTYSKVDRAHLQGARFHYVLVPAPDRGKAFVPEDDQCLRLAMATIPAEPGCREYETLSAEVRRRKLTR